MHQCPGEIKLSCRCKWGNWQHSQLSQRMFMNIETELWVGKGEATKYEKYYCSSIAKKDYEDTSLWHAYI